MASSGLGLHGACANRQFLSTAWPCQIHPQCLPARVVCSSSSSSRAGSSQCAPAVRSCSTQHVSTDLLPSSKPRRGRALRVLSSRTEPSSLQSSYDEPSTSNTEDYGYMQEYAALKKQLLDNTRKSGGAIGLYLLLTVNGQAALLAMTGAAASYGYLLWLCRDVDNVRPTDEVPIWEANKIENPLLRRAAKLKAAYQKALSPRLLVPVGLGILIGVYNRVSGDTMPVLLSGCLLLGFFSHKVALVIKLVHDLTPKSFSEPAKRPTVEKIEDELDQWGRPKKKLSNPIDVMPDDMQEQAYQQLKEQMAREERRAGQE